MEKSKEVMEELKAKITGAQEYFEGSDIRALAYVTYVVGKALREALNDLCLQIEERHKVGEAKNEREKFVIHYTSIAALVSMLQDVSKKEQERESEKKEREGAELELALKPGDKQSLWRLYDSVHLNDPEEGNLLIRNLPRQYDWLGKREESHAYIASFIFNGKKDMSDDLVFWHAYGKEGKGCSLSLCVPRSRLQEVLYGTTEVKRTVNDLRSVLDLLEPLVRIRKLSIRERVRERLATIVWGFLERIRYLYKSDAYEYEKECRLVVAESGTDKNKIRFEDQDRNNYHARIRHYYEHEKLAIKELLTTGSSITLGPCVPDSYNMRYYLEALKRKAGLIGPKIKFSKISYRKS